MNGLKAWLVGVHNAAWELELTQIERKDEDGRIVLLFRVPYWAKHIRVEIPVEATTK